MNTYEQLKTVINKYESASHESKQAYRHAAAAGSVAPHETLDTVDSAESEASRMIESEWENITAAQRGALRRMYGEFVARYAPQRFV